MQTDGTTETVRQYYAIAWVTAGMRDGSIFYYFLTDHLGSVVGVTDSTGTMVSETRYLPFGEVRTDVGSVIQTDYGYTFQRNVSGMGLMDYKARYYSGLLGRFVQPDTLIPGAGDPQAWNRYSYTTKNPINFNDPTGHMMDVDDGGSCVGVLCLLHEPKPDLPQIKPVPTPTTGGTPSPKPTPTPTPIPMFPDGGQSDEGESGGGSEYYYNFAPLANIVINYPGDFTLYQSPMFLLIGGYRFFTTFKGSESFNTPLKIGGNSIGFGDFSLKKNSFSFNYFSSPLNEKYINSFNIEFFTPWRAKFSVDSSINVDNVKITTTYGIEYVARTDRIALIPVTVLTGLVAYLAFTSGYCSVSALCTNPLQ